MKRAKVFFAISVLCTAYSSLFSFKFLNTATTELRKNFENNYYHTFYKDVRELRDAGQAKHEVFDGIANTWCSLMPYVLDAFRARAGLVQRTKSYGVVPAAELNDFEEAVQFFDDFALALFDSGAFVPQRVMQCFYDRTNTFLNILKNYLKPADQIEAIGVLEKLKQRALGKGAKEGVAEPEKLAESEEKVEELAVPVEAGTSTMHVVVPRRSELPESELLEIAGEKAYQSFLVDFDKFLENVAFDALYEGQMAMLEWEANVLASSYSGDANVRQIMGDFLRDCRQFNELFEIYRTVVAADVGDKAVKDAKDKLAQFLVSIKKINENAFRFFNDIVRRWGDEVQVAPHTPVRKAEVDVAAGKKPVVVASDLTTRNELEAQRTVLLWRIDVLEAEGKPASLIAAKRARLAEVEEALRR